MQYKPANWVTGFKRSPRAANVQNRDMGLFLNSSGKFEPIDDAWDSIHSGGIFISDDNKLYFRDETNKDIYINSPAAETLGLSAGNATTAGFVTINEEGFDTDFRVEASGEANALFVQGSDGAVGIGTDSPDYSLHVVGDYNLAKFNTTRAGSDGVYVQLEHFSSSPTNDDNLAYLVFKGYNDAETPEEINYGVIETRSADIGNGTEDGKMIFRTMVAGTDTRNLVINNGNVGIGEDDPGARLEVLGPNAVGEFFTAGNYGAAGVVFQRIGTSSPHNSFDFWNGSIKIGTAGMGIDFSNQASPATGMTSELLDRYEEGTFTVALGGTTETLANATAYYTRIGNVVYFAYYSQSSTLASATGTATITGLPFTSAHTSNLQYHIFNSQHTTAVDGSSRGGYIVPNDTYCIWLDENSTSGASYIDSSNLYIMVSGCYRTAT